MKKNLIIAASLMASIAIFSCNTEQNKEIVVEEIIEIEEEVADPVEIVNETSIEEIDELRASIEGLEMESVEVSTENLRSKIKQKWSKLHFYVQNDVVVKVKSYPYPDISQRTEEFYANETGLLLVVIEDNGEGSKGKMKSDIDKMYYFNNDKLIKETRKDVEEEYSLEADADELLTEFKEYLTIYGNLEK